MRWRSSSDGQRGLVGGLAHGRAVGRVDVLARPGHRLVEARLEVRDGMSDDPADLRCLAGRDVGDRGEQAERYDDLRRRQRAGGRGRRALPGEHLEVALVGVRGLAGQGVPLVVEPDHLGAEVDVEGLLGVAAHVEPAQDRRLQHPQGVLGRGRTARGRRHLLHAGEAHEAVAEPGRPRHPEDLLDQLVPDGERRAGRRVVHAGRLEVDVLEGPAHRPVDLPDQLPLVLRGEVGGVGVPVGARVREVGRVVVVRRDGGGVAPARAAVRLEREALQLGAALGVLLVGDGLSARAAASCSESVSGRPSSCGSARAPPRCRARCRTASSTCSR